MLFFMTNFGKMIENIIFSECEKMLAFCGKRCYTTKNEFLSGYGISAKPNNIRRILYRFRIENGIFLGFDG